MTPIGRQDVAPLDRTAELAIPCDRGTMGCRVDHSTDEAESGTLCVAPGAIVELRPGKQIRVTWEKLASPGDGATTRALCLTLIDGGQEYDAWEVPFGKWQRVIEAIVATGAAMMADERAGDDQLF